MPAQEKEIPADLYSGVQILWEYHQMHHEVRPCSVGLGLGSHDLGVATYTAELFHRRMFPMIVFSGANVPTTRDRFPRGEAVHYRDHAIELGVPADAILVEPRATNTGENFTFSRELLTEHGVAVDSILVISRPYQQRRAYATCKKLWPDVDVVSASRPFPLPEYVKSIGDADRVINMLVGDTQRIIEYPKLGYAMEQEMPLGVHKAYTRLVKAGFTSRLIKHNR